MLGVTTSSYSYCQYFSLMKLMRLLYTLAPSGRKKHDPGERMWKKNSSWFSPITRWSRFFASSMRSLYSFMSFSVGNVTA